MTRREWLARIFRLGGLGLLAGGIGSIIVDVWMAAGQFSTSHWKQLGSLQDLPRSGTVAFPRERVALLRRNDRIAALSLECTHLGCLVHSIDQGFYCPCHGSEFGPDGEVYSGPAPRSLPWHDLRVSHGRLWVQSGIKHPAPRWIAFESGQQQGANS